MGRDFYTVPEVCHILKISDYYVRKHIRDGAFPAYRVGNRCVIPKKDFERWMKDHEDSV